MSKLPDMEWDHWAFRGFSMRYCTFETSNFLFPLDTHAYTYIVFTPPSSL